MKLKFVVSTLSAFFVALASIPAQATMVTDAHGNVGYSTAAECDAAVHAGTAKFYQPFTQHKPLIRKGEKGVQPARIRNLGAEYKYGSCDMGVGKKLNREGVSAALQGTYIPFSPDMPINAYTDATGAVVRVTMAQCDNWFSGNAPRPVAAPKPKPAPTPVTKPVVTPPRPPVVAPVPVLPPPVIESSKGGIRPYVFATIGGLNDGWKVTETQTNNLIEKSNYGVGAAQLGLGVQVNPVLGLEAFAQPSLKRKPKMHEDGYQESMQNQTFGGRVTLGPRFGADDKSHLFAKLGVAGVKHVWKHNGTDTIGISKKVRARPTLGLGYTYNYTDNFAVRADYDHVFKHNFKKVENEFVNAGDDMKLRFRGTNYLGLGVQYTF